MRVKFSDSFLTRLETVGITIGFSRYRICMLADRDNILDDSRQTLVEEGEVSYIWNDEVSTMDLTFLGTDRINNRETSSNPFVIYLYENNQYEIVEGPSLVLFDNNYSVLNLTSRGLNHITIKFPETTHANISNRVDNKNQKYLESRSNLTGTSIFLAELGRSEEDDLITKNSYLKYIRNKKSSNNIISYLNKDGKKIFSKSWYKRYRSIDLYASSLVGNKDKGGTRNYYLPSTSGTISIGGECIYDLYEIVEGEFILRKKNQVENINNVVLVGSNLDTDKFKIVNNKTIAYSDVEDSSTTSFYGELFFKDEMKGGLQIPLKSNKINFYQYSTWGKPITTTNLFEDNKHLFLFNSDGYAIGTSSGNSSKYHEITIRLKKSVDPSSINISHSSPIVKTYFNFNVSKNESESKNGLYSYTIRISTVGTNSSKTWYPIIGDKSYLQSSTISLGPNNSIQIFCVQGPSLPIVLRDITRTNDLDKNSKGNYVGHLGGIIGKKKADYYVTSSSLVEGYNTWVCNYSFFNSSVNFVDKRVGKIVETIGESGKISITSYDMPSTESELEIGSITFKRAPNSGEIDNSNWKDVMYSNAGSCTLDLMLARDTSSKSYATITSSTQYFLKESDSSLKRLYMFDHLGKTFENTDNPDVAEHWFEFLIDESIPKNSIVLEPNGLDRFFNIKVESPVESTKKAGWYKYRIIITTKGGNNSETMWLPTNSSNISDVIKAKIEFKSSISGHIITEEFYCVQGFSVEPIRVYVENKKPEWIDLVGNHGATSASNSGSDFEFDKQEDFDKYTSNDKNLGKHSVGDIISLGNINSGIRKARMFRMLVNTYSLYNENDFIDFKGVGESVNIALSKPINDYTYWKDVSVGNTKIKLTSSNQDNLLNNEFTSIGNGKFVYSNSDKNLPTAKYKVELKNQVEPSKNHNVVVTTLFDRVSSSSVNVEDLLSDWKYLMMKDNGVSTAKVKSRILTSSAEDNIVVRTDDNKEWIDINLLPLDYIGIYRVYVSCPEDFIVTLTSNDNISFLDEQTSKPLINTLSVDYEKTAPGQFIPIYFTFEGGEQNAFRSSIQDLSTEINIAYRKDPSINKKVSLRRYYIDGIPSSDGKNLGSKSSTGDILSSSITSRGYDPTSSAVVRSGSGKDVFSTYNRELNQYSAEISYVSNIETNTRTVVSSKITKENIFDLAGFSGNRIKEKGKYIGSGKGYLYTDEKILYTEYPSKITSSYPLPVIDTITTRQEGTGNEIIYSVYHKPQEPRISLSNYDYKNLTRYGNKIYIIPSGPGTRSSEQVGLKQSLYVDISVQGQSFIVRKLRGDSLGLIAGDNKVYLNRYDKNSIGIEFSISEVNKEVLNSNGEVYAGTIEFESYIDKDNFLLDENGNVRSGQFSYSQDIVNLITGTTSVTFDIYVARKERGDTTVNKDYHTFNQDFGGIIPADGGEMSIELNPSFENRIVSQSPDKTPFSGANILSDIKVSSLLGKKYLNIEFASRASRTGYTKTGIDLASSVTNINNFCDSNSLPKIYDLSDGLVADNFTVTFEPEGKETSRYVYNTAEQIPSFKQKPYTHGIVISTPFTNSEGFLPGGLNANTSKLFIGKNNRMNVELNCTYKDIIDFHKTSDSSYSFRITTLLLHFYLATVELPTRGQTEFGKQDLDSLIISNTLVPSSIPVKLSSLGIADLLKTTIYNYGYRFSVGGDDKKEFEKHDVFTVSDGWGNSVFIWININLKPGK